MKTFKHAFIALAIGSMATSCVQETVWVSDEVSTRSYDFEHITALQVATDFNAYVTFSETEERVEIEANDNLFNKMDVYMEGNRLVVKLENNIRVKGRETLNLYITTKNISWFKASSDAAIFLENTLTAGSVSIDLSSDAHFIGDIVADDFELRAESDSDAELYLEATNAYFDLSSNAYVDGEATIEDGVFRLSADATVDLLGNVDHMDAVLSSDAELKGYGLHVNDLEVELSSDAEAYLTVFETIDVIASSDGRLYYKGDADIVRQVLSSGGKVIKK
ncbi:head GIN domain-containing protein [Flagellimonas iocasae]|uniref:Head GIN domain-containing protein n=1 Tax=Flagellimonas iocasae TaxID=2055905 RepID=A0ABW4XYL0_9FLAO